MTTNSKGALGVLALFVHLGCAPVPIGVTYSSCNGEQVKKLQWSVAYMRAAARSRSFQRCLKGAVEGSYGPGTAIWGGGAFMHTYQESSHVGPYHACGVPSGNALREPSFVYQGTPFQYQNRLLAYEAALAVATTTEPLVLTCTNSSSYTAEAPDDHGYLRLQHDTPYQFTNRVNVGLRVFTQFPDHQTETYQEEARFGTVMPSYPIDEVSGILLHEILHNYGFEHGGDSNQCGYPEGFDIGRFHSLNEIAEACMSEVVEGSVALCTSPCVDQNSLSIVTNPQAVTDVTIPHSCQCTPFQ